MISKSLEINIKYLLRLLNHLILSPLFLPHFSPISALMSKIVDLDAVFARKKLLTKIINHFLTCFLSPVFFTLKLASIQRNPLSCHFLRLTKEGNANF